MKIIVISRSEWSDLNSTGHTLSSFFGAFPVESLANVYFRSALPSNNVCKTYISITELSALSGQCNVFQTEASVEKRSKEEKDVINKPHFKFKNCLSEIERRLVNAFRGSKFVGIYILQDLFWQINWWKSKTLNDFLDKFSPEVIFFPSFGDPYTHRVARYIANYCDARLVVFHADDHIFKEDQSRGILKKFYRSLIKKEIEKTIKSSSLNFAISDSMRSKYSEFFKVDFDVLKKGYEFDASEMTLKTTQQNIEKIKKVSEIKCVYIGSIEYGRWKSLVLIVDAMRSLMSDNVRFSLAIYSQYLPSEKIRSQIESRGISEFHGSLDQKNIKKVIRDYHMVLHVESFDEIDIELTRHSFSTKIVDCLASNTPMLAVGPKGIASMDYLIQNDLATCIYKRDDVKQKLNEIYHSRELIILKAEKARIFAFEKFNIETVRKNLFEKISKII